MPAYRSSESFSWEEIRVKVSHRVSDVFSKAKSRHRENISLSKWTKDKNKLESKFMNSIVGLMFLRPLDQRDCDQFDDLSVVKNREVKIR